jgi:hypothetical protein
MGTWTRREGARVVQVLKRLRKERKKAGTCCNSSTGFYLKIKAANDVRSRKDVVNESEEVRTQERRDLVCAKALQQGVFQQLHFLLHLRGEWLSRPASEDCLGTHNLEVCNLLVPCIL